MKRIKVKSNRKDSILSLITLQGNRGATIEFLMKETGIDRWKIGEICKNLELHNEIKNKRKGRLNIYYPNHTAFEYNSYVESLLFKKKILSDYFADNISGGMIDLFDPIELLKKKFDKKEFSKIKWRLTMKQRESILKIIYKDNEIKSVRSIPFNNFQQKLQSFILNVGFFITYAFLIASSSKLTKAVSEELESDSENAINMEILNWLSRLISPKDFYDAFRQMFSRCGIKDFEYKYFDGNGKKITTFDLTESMFIEVSSILGQLYPKQYSKLNEIYQGLKEGYVKEKKFVTRKNCHHEYEIIYELMDSIVFFCQKCKKTIPYQKSNIWNSHQIEEKLKLGIYQKNKEIESIQINSEISDLDAKCNFFNGKHQLYLRKSHRDDILDGAPIEKNFQCLLCNNGWFFIIGKEVMEKISAEIEYNVGNDIYSKILSNSIFKFILYNKDLSINIDKVTLQKLAVYGLYFKYHKHIIEFDKDKKSILKILLKYRFINHVI